MPLTTDNVRAYFPRRGRVTRSRRGGARSCGGAFVADGLELVGRGVGGQPLLDGEQLLRAPLVRARDGDLDVVAVPSVVRAGAVGRHPHPARRRGHARAAAAEDVDLAMPVEVVQFCWKYNQVRLQDLFNDEGCEAKLRLDEGGKPYVTDNSNYIVDLYFKTPIKDALAAGKEISALEGVVEHGLFLDMATSVIIAGTDGVSVKTK